MQPWLQAQGPKQGGTASGYSNGSIATDAVFAMYSVVPCIAHLHTQAWSQAQSQAGQLSLTAAHQLHDAAGGLTCSLSLQPYHLVTVLHAVE